MHYDYIWLRKIRPCQIQTANLTKGLRSGETTVDTSRATSTFRVFDDGDALQMENARRRVQRLEGVLNVEADHISHVMSVEYNSDRISLSEIKKAVRPSIENGLRIRGKKR